MHDQEAAQAEREGRVQHECDKQDDGPAQERTRRQGRGGMILTGEHPRRHCASAGAAEGGHASPLRVPLVSVSKPLW